MLKRNRLSSTLLLLAFSCSSMSVNCFADVTVNYGKGRGGAVFTLAPLDCVTSVKLIKGNTQTSQISIQQSCSMSGNLSGGKILDNPAYKIRFSAPRIIPELVKIAPKPMLCDATRPGGTGVYKASVFKLISHQRLNKGMNSVSYSCERTINTKTAAVEGQYKYILQKLGLDASAAADSSAEYQYPLNGQASLFVFHNTFTRKANTDFARIGTLRVLVGRQ